MEAGKYSLLVQAIEPGGLLGQSGPDCPVSGTPPFLSILSLPRYWDIQWLYGLPVLTRQDRSYAAVPRSLDEPL